MMKISRDKSKKSNTFVVEELSESRCLYINIGDHTVYIDVSMLETSGEFIVNHWDNTKGEE